jgi:hypothetical protein
VGGQVPAGLVLGLTAGLAEQEHALPGLRRVPRPALVATAGALAVLAALLAVMAVAGRVL